MKTTRDGNGRDWPLNGGRVKICGHEGARNVSSLFLCVYMFSLPQGERPCTLLQHELNKRLYYVQHDVVWWFVEAQINVVLVGFKGMKIGNG
jgi:hypothetical protein